MVDVAGVVACWEVDARPVRARLSRAPTPRERERWHAVWLLAQSWSANTVAGLLERDAHTIGAWLAVFAQDGPAALAFEQTGGPPALGAEAQAGLTVAVPAAPRDVGIALANGTWQVVRQFVEARCGVRLCRSAGTRSRHRLGFAEAIWAWAREEVTATTCLGTKAAVQEPMRQFFAGLPARVAEVQSRCRRKVQALAEALAVPSPESHPESHHGDPIGASV